MLKPPVLEMAASIKDLTKLLETALPVIAIQHRSQVGIPPAQEKVTR
jgi:hypothetical protein